MTLNIEKCFHIKYTRKKTPLTFTYLLNSTPLEKVQLIRDLGIYLDSKLTFIQHTDKIVTKGAQMLGFVKRNSTEFKTSTKVLLYKTLVRSQLEYGSVVWSPFYTKHSQRIESLQRSFTRHLAFHTSNFSHRHPYNQRLEKFRLISLRERRKLMDMTFLHKIISGKTLCSQLLECFSLTVPFNYPRFPIHKIFHIPASRTNLGSQNPTSRISKEYNTLHTKINDLDIFNNSLAVFKRKIFQYSQTQSSLT